jgi:hypothetical protein
MWGRACGCAILASSTARSFAESGVERQRHLIVRVAKLPDGAATLAAHLAHLMQHGDDAKRQPWSLVRAAPSALLLCRRVLSIDLQWMGEAGFRLRLVDALRLCVLDRGISLQEVCFGQGKASRLWLCRLLSGWCCTAKWRNGSDGSRVFCGPVCRSDCAW